MERSPFFSSGSITLYYVALPRGAARRGFTLVELLVVVAIIALLIAILLPGLRLARQHGQSAKCLAHLRQLSLAVVLYTQENQDRFPPWGLAHGGSGNPLQSWLNKLGPEFGGITDPNAGEQVNGLVKCPSDQSEFWRVPLSGITRQTSYASNYLLVYDGYRKNRLAKAPRPSSTIFWAELVEENKGPPGGAPLGFPVADHVHPDNWEQNLLIAANNDELERWASYEVEVGRHRGRANYALLDGHAAPFKFQETFACDFANTNLAEGRVEWFRNKYDPDVAR